MQNIWELRKEQWAQQHQTFNAEEPYPTEEMVNVVQLWILNLHFSNALNKYHSPALKSRGS